MEEPDGTRRPPCRLPERLFAVGEEPAGVRVTPYHKAGAIREILNALDPAEVDHIRSSPFGRLIEIADKPSFSGRFGRYILSRQLKVFKKHEAWFLFAGKPIRFSIREFAMVTGLNCSKFPKRGKKKSRNFMEDKPYWGELFGSLREVPVSSVVKMLAKKTVVDRDIRLKYAYLALVSAVILPTTHAPRISVEYAEMIKDLDTFLAHPWGRVSFEMLISSIKERKEVSLLQNTIALKGFVLALQLVIVECVPALTEVVQDGSSSGSDGETGGDDNTLEMEKGERRNISPGHARDTDAAGKAIVESILLDANGEITVPEVYQWSDDEDDGGVSNMVGLIEQRYGFSNDCFVGGATIQDVIKMREESKAEIVNRKIAKSKAGTSYQAQDGLDTDLLASIVREKLKDDFQLLHGSISTIQESSNGFTETILVNINEVFGMVQDNARAIKTLSDQISKFTPTPAVATVDSVPPRPKVVNAGTQTIDDSTDIIGKAINFANRSSVISTDPANKNYIQDVEMGSEPNTVAHGVTTDGCQEGGQGEQNTSEDEQLHPPQTATVAESPLDPALVFPNPTFSLGLTQEAVLVKNPNSNVNVETDQQVSEEDNHVDANIPEADGCRKSKRHKVLTKSLMAEYQCDKGFLNRARKAVADAIYKGGDIDYSAKFGALMEKMKKPFDLTTAKGTLQSTELKEVIERATQLSTKVVDVLMFHTSSLFRSGSSLNYLAGPVFMDTQFVSQFTKLYSKFSKSSKKDNYKFSGEVTEMFMQLPAYADADRFYFPFCLDKTYWVGICVDCGTWSVTVFDCNISIRTDYMMNKEVRPLALMFPYLLKQVGRQVGTRDCKAMAIERPRSIPQQNEVKDSGVSSVFFIQAHAVGGSMLANASHRMS
ncbi:hypothetical protein Rs2_51671 [Raphanus sativus]|nr:hypothetical protein Rs2_51671 [Raphanus sativus]